MNRQPSSNRLPAAASDWRAGIAFAALFLLLAIGLASLFRGRR